MQTLALQDGGTLAYMDRGTGRPLVFLHGWAVHGGFFAQQMPLASDSRLVVPDLRGHGRSAALPPGHGLEMLAHDLDALLESLAIEGAVLVGWSMGAMLAWDLALASPDRFAGLVVVDMAPRITTAPGWRLGLRDGHGAGDAAHQAAAMQDDWPAFCRRFVPRIFAEGLDRGELTEWAMAEVLDNDPAAMGRLWLDLASRDDRSRLPALSLPILVVSGARSQLYAPATGRWLADSLPHAQQILFDRSGHAPHLEEPARFNSVLTDFCQGLAAPDTGRAPIPIMSGTNSQGDEP